MQNIGAFTIPEFSVWSRIGRTKVYELTGSGQLPVVKIGKKTLIRTTDAIAWLNGLPGERTGSAKAGVGIGRTPAEVA